MYKDEELVIRSQNGDIDAFEELVTRYERKIYTIAFRFIGNPDDASDLTQEAFMKAFSGLKNFRGEASFQTWMCRIVTNVCRDELRKRCRNPVDWLEGKITLEEGEVTRQVPSHDLGPEELYEKKELQEHMQELIATLSPEFRLTLVLRDIQGFSYEEIAEQLNCSLGTVKSRLNRARNYVKEKLLLDREQKPIQERLTI